ncbi:unnamed protein product [Meganyctiphanes norvegica]|uniref:CHK kinase-like domain-containing protein n=1 Tax=Meganyctiphanes norvegica TaxID=48144 RepID=A0AAV2RSY9_MEGNR
MNNEESSQDTEYNFVVKLESQHPLQQSYFQITGFYIREHMMYTSVIPELNKFQKEKANDAYRIDMPKCLYSKCEDGEFVLVLENLTKEGFSMHSKENTMELNEVKLVIDQLARLHAVSYAYDKSYGFLNNFPDFSNTDYHRHMSYFETAGVIDTLVAILKQVKDEEILTQKLVDLREHLIQKANDLHDANRTHKILCLNHGDPHSNNMLFKYKTLEDGTQIIDCIKVLDWQIAQWNTPIYDLQYMINTSTSPEFRKTHLNDILHYYHSIFMEITDNLGEPVSNLSYDVFQKEYSKMDLFGLVKGIYINGIQSPGSAKRTMEKTRSEINSSILWKTMMSNISKVMTYFITSSAVNSFITNDLKWRLQPVIDDVVSGREPIVASQILGSVLEADENGLFDEMFRKEHAINCLCFTS